jgi:predicted dehydrogenase
MTLRCAVIGVGHLGRIHAEKYKMISDATLVGVCDIDGGRANTVAAALGVPAYTNASDVLSKVDAVTIAASTSAHAELCRLFLQNGVHVLVEKPLTDTSTEAQDICELAERSGLRLQVGHIERFNPALRAVVDKLHEPMFIECHRLAPFTARSLDTDVVLDLMIHDLDVILSLVRSKPKKLDAIGTPVLTKKLDIANARIEFHSGAVANVTASRVSQNTQRKLRVFQRDQYLSIDLQAGDVMLLTKTGEWSGGNIPLEREHHSVGKGDALLDQAKDFVASVIGKRPSSVAGSAQEGMEALKLAEEIVKDAKRRLR